MQISKSGDRSRNLLEIKYDYRFSMSKIGIVLFINGTRSRLQTDFHKERV